MTTALLDRPPTQFSAPLPDGTLFTAVRLARAAHLPTDGPGAVNQLIRVARRLINEDDKIVAVLQNVITAGAHTAVTLRQYGFNDSIIDAVEALTVHADDTSATRATRIENNPIAERVRLAN